jgi:hypothetical protein
MQNAWNVVKNDLQGNINILEMSGKASGLGYMTYQEAWQHFMNNTAAARTQYSIFVPPELNVHWCKRSQDIMPDWEVLYQHLEPEVNKTEVTLLGAESMLPIGLDKGFPTEKSFIVLQGEVCIQQFQHVLLLQQVT